MVRFVTYLLLIPCLRPRREIHFCNCRREGRGIGNGSVAGSLSTLDGEESHVDDIDFEEGFRATLGDAFGRVWHGITADDSEGEEEEEQEEQDGLEGPETWI